jgi:hypothetical protein
MSSPHTVEVVVEALRNEATTWDTEGDAMTGIGSWLNGATIEGASLGIFFAMHDVYESTRSQVAGWCAGGGTNMHAIADELRRNATAYETTDADVAQSVEGAY